MSMPTTATSVITYRVVGRPRVSQADPAYLSCNAVPEFDPLTADEEEPAPIRVLVKRQSAARIGDGVTFRSDQLSHVDGLGAPILTPPPVEQPAPAAAQPAVSTPVPGHPRITHSNIPQDRDTGWGDDDALNAPPPQTAPTQQTQPQHRPQPATQVAQTIKQREAAVLDAGKEVPLELVRTLRITAKAYNMVSTLIGATGRPGPQDVRALVITNIIAWAKNDQGLDDKPTPDEAQVEAMENLLKAQL